MKSILLVTVLWPEKLAWMLLLSPKCGTTWLYSALEQHPGLCLSNPKEKRNCDSQNFVSRCSDPDLKKYMKYFKGEGMKIDCSIHAFACPEAPSRIKENYPNAKFIICVREPVARTISHWKIVRETVTYAQEQIGQF